MSRETRTKVGVTLWVRRVAVRVLLLAASVAFALGIMELVVRTFYSPNSSRMDDFNLSKSSYYQPDPELRWLPKPNVQGRHDRTGSFSSSFSTNSRGLRDSEHTIEKPVGTRRIVTLGDSFTWGWGVDDDELYPSLLEQYLPDTEVINLGVTAFRPRDYITYLEREGWQYAPDVVLVGLCMNDIYRDGEAHQPAPTTTQARRPRARSLKQFFLEHSALYGFVIARVNASKGLANLFVALGIKESLAGFDELDPNVKPALKSFPPAMERSLRAMESELLRLERLTSERGVELVVAVIPSLQSVDSSALASTVAYTEFDVSDFDTAKPYRLLEEFGENNSIHVVNPHPSFARAARTHASLYLSRDMHFNAAGHDLFAKEVARGLQELSLYRNTPGAEGTTARPSHARGAAQ